MKKPDYQGTVLESIVEMTRLVWYLHLDKCPVLPPNRSNSGEPLHTTCRVCAGVDKITDKAIETHIGIRNADKAKPPVEIPIPGPGGETCGAKRPSFVDNIITSCVLAFVVVTAVTASIAIPMMFFRWLMSNH